MSFPKPTDSTTDRRWLSWLARLPLPVLRAAGAVLGAALYVGAPRRRRIVAANLSACFPQETPATHRSWTWATFKHFGQSFVDRVWLWHAPPSTLERRLEVVGLEHLPPGGALCFAPHFFGLDAGWTALTRLGQRPWWTLYMPQVQPAIDAWVYAGRQRHAAAHVVSRHDGGMRPLLRAMREGGTVYLLPDMDLGARNAVFAPFFGVRAATVTTLARMAGSAQVPVLPVVSRLVPGGYRVEVLPAWEGYPTGDDVADATRMNAELEGWIRTMPGQYHWLHRRFKTRPPGERPLYRD